MEQTACIHKHFPAFSAFQLERFEQLAALLRQWNTRHNLISRRDLPYLCSRHLLHSLAVAKFMAFKAGTRVLDIGTGGGLPGLPLAIAFPRVHFLLTDSKAKKVLTVESISASLGLRNVEVQQHRFGGDAPEGWKERFDFTLSRAVTDLKTLYAWSCPLLTQRPRHRMPNGLIAFKGGKTASEKKRVPVNVQQVPIQQYFNDPVFADKYLLYLPV